jgi:ATP-dependent RNA helicase DDX51/DBP6
VNVTKTKSDDTPREDTDGFDTEEIVSDKVVGAAVQVAKEVKKPKKRRKIVEESEDMVMEDVHHNAQHLEQTPHELSRTRSPETTLPSFPLPAIPDAPSKSALALQGLDQALLDAEIVDPTTLMAIRDGEGDGGTGLGEKMRKRLRDLGVTELFAGM